jgi:RNA polymerase sigma-70 factor (ECF subfamily)
MTTDAWTRSATQSRDEATFDALFLTHYQPIFRLLYRIAGTREEAEDLTQETFLRLHRSPELWKGLQPEPREHNVRAWLYRVATNLAYNALRSQQRRTRREDVVLGQTLSAGRSDPDPVEVAERDDERAAVRRALAALPERQAQLLLMRHAGFSYRELAEALGIAAGSVGTSLVRAEAAFEKVYQNLRGSEGGRR